MFTSLLDKSNSADDDGRSTTSVENGKQKSGLVVFCMLTDACKSCHYVVLYGERTL